MKITSATLLPLILISAACSRSGAETTPYETEADSIMTELATRAVTPAYLPDTVYASAGGLKTAIEVYDSIDDGQQGLTDDMYGNRPGHFTFRGNPRRDAAFGGTVKGEPDSIIVDWCFRTEEDYTPTDFGAWGGGSGWTGQPLYVEWPKGNSAGKGKEIMVGSLVGKVYFIDFETGKASRPAISAGNPIKGTISLDPSLNGNLYVGQGIPAHGQMGALVIDLKEGRMTDFFGRDPKAWRAWGAYDSSPVRVGNYLFRPGENGTIYKYTVGQGKLIPHSSMRYRADGRAPGIESSMSVYRNYGYTCDNDGNVVCTNLGTLQPVWRYKLPDDTDATPVVAEDPDGKAYVYVGCEVENPAGGEATFVKLDAATGRQMWKNTIPARRKDSGGKHFDGGYFASALPGTGDCADLIFCNVVTNTDSQDGSFVAFDRATGKTVYSTKLRYYSWSSPVAFTNEKGKMYVLTGDCAGNAYLIDGKSGKIIFRTHVGNNFESSPVVKDNCAVVGSRGNSIYKLRIE